MHSASVGVDGTINSFRRGLKGLLVFVMILTNIKINLLLFDLQLYLKHFYKSNYIEIYSNKLKQRPYRHNRTSYHEAIT